LIRLLFAVQGLLCEKSGFERYYVFGTGINIMRDTERMLSIPHHAVAPRAQDRLCNLKLREMILLGWLELFLPSKMFSLPFPEVFLPRERFLVVIKKISIPRQTILLPRGMISLPSGRFSLPSGTILLTSRKILLTREMFLLTCKMSAQH
jgi:hypothetical protein